LLSALAFHDLTTQNPSEVWLTLEGTRYCPHLEQVDLCLTRATGAAFTCGIESHQVEGVPIQVYSPAKTVADCFKHRSKVGLEVALEALEETCRKSKATLEELRVAAQHCRVERLMRPYLEALSAWGPPISTTRHP
jgi:predicted transcriptional regulator of viral defense system